MSNAKSKSKNHCLIQLPYLKNFCHSFSFYSYFKMSFQSRISSSIKDYTFLQLDGMSKIFCSRCNCHIKVDEIHLKSQINSHIKSKKHQSNSATRQSQPLISTSLSSATSQMVSNKTYSERLTKCFIEAAIPIWKLTHPSVINFFKMEHNRELPSSTTLYNHVDVVYQQSLQKVNKYLF